jgi:hypothetical protein
MTNEERMSILENQVDNLSQRNLELIDNMNKNAENINILFDSALKNTEYLTTLSETMTGQANLLTNQAKMRTEAFKMIEDLYKRV